MRVSQSEKFLLDAAATDVVRLVEGVDVGTGSRERRTPVGP